MKSLGLDIGSTTLKAVMLDAGGDPIFRRYLRHNADVSGVLGNVLRDAAETAGDEPVGITVAGSVGMGVAQSLGLPFVQEVVSALTYIRRRQPDISTLIDIGGEDAKIIYLNREGGVDMRMNGACAGGTGAFLDQMAILLGIGLDEMNALARTSKTIHPIASRCGVFSKTDVQNLVSANIPREDIAASVFHAVALQVTSSLARGCEITPKVFLCGGPLTFLPALRQAFADCLGLPLDDFITPEYAHLIPAWGAAIESMNNANKIRTFAPAELARAAGNIMPGEKETSSLPPLFSGSGEYEIWLRKKNGHSLPKASSSESCEEAYLGIDSGSTTTKIVAANARGEILFDSYAPNDGSPLEVVRRGLAALSAARPGLKIAAAAATGYGEELLKAAFGLDYGLIETVAHYLAARKLSPEVSFILDIGGQDMKAIFVSGGAVARTEINEACSSGCGSFVETFARSLGYTASDFARLACLAEAPADLGTRCTVFMNSKVKPALREGSGAGDIAAGLAYSVAKNCLFKVLKLRHTEELGDEIVVQGGAMRSDAVTAAFEHLTGRTVLRPNQPELMGAYGAAIYAAAHTAADDRPARPLTDLLDIPPPECSALLCRGCENLCSVTKYVFAGGASYVSGNKCEKVFHSRGASSVQGVNIYSEKRRLLFDRAQTPKPDGATIIGIPRALNMYEEYPFWHTLFDACGIKTVLSDPSTFGLFESGARCVMSDNLCFPAKLTHGHILNLIALGVDRVFMPYVVHEKQEGANEANSFNCPIVSGYSDVVKSVTDTKIPIDSPTITFRDRKLLFNACRRYLRVLGIKGSVAARAFDKAERAQAEFETRVRQLNIEAFRKAELEERPVVLLAGRPYHADPLIQQKAAEMIASLGADVLTDDIVRGDAACDIETENDGRLVRQWAYVNRIMRAAEWAARQNHRVQFAELNSFGCGPDAFLQEEVAAVLRRRGKSLTLLKIDDMTSSGALKLRVRSLVESGRHANAAAPEAAVQMTKPISAVKFFSAADRGRTLLVPFMSEYMAPLLAPLGKLAGYRLESLPKSTNETAETGLRYANNEVCYPATLVIGDIIHALQSGRYDLSKTAVLISQTGGQCRASNYVALLRGAMAEAGFDDVPVLCMGFVEKAKGLGINWRKLLPVVLAAILYADSISKFHHAAAVREKTPGLAWALTDKYLNLAGPLIERGDRDGIYELLGEAALEYDASVTDAALPKVGVVGEIYLKLNSFANRSASEWLMRRGVEVAPAGLLPFFTQTFVNRRVNVELDLARPTLTDFLISKTYRWAARQIARANAAGRKFRYFTPFSDIFEEAAGGAEIVSLAAQFGEGWILPAETVSFARSGVNNVLCLQPFGCISNHVVAKGVEKKIRNLYPGMNLLALDYDGGTSQVNVNNRLLLFMNNLEYPACHA
ncbi:MAG: acyl-CoA dehydratase activase-related protein [Acidobacteriota bacterium]|jgi:predicted CoA-substrate-specific enzyme activase|nr:acyl-CoA dehydratase activase-related protein [Acidobacteriota bacterium]